MDSESVSVIPRASFSLRSFDFFSETGRGGIKSSILGSAFMSALCKMYAQESWKDIAARSSYNPGTFYSIIER